MPRAETRVVVVDDQTIVREGLVLLLGLIDGVEVVGAGVDGEEAVALVERHHPDVVLMDMHMPRCDGVEATRGIRSQYPGTQVVALSTYSDDDTVASVMGAGAAAYVTKDSTATEIRHAIVHASVPAPADVVVAPPTSSADDADELSEREAAVLDLIAAGRRNAQIAEELFISTATVKTHVNRLFAKIGVDNREDAVAYARAHGFARSPTPGQPVVAEPSQKLTRREAEVLDLIAAGRRNREIAEVLFISEATVKTHVSNLLAKTGVRNRAEAIAYVLGHRRGPMTAARRSSPGVRGTP